jgi:hypothetical protein
MPFPGLCVNILQNSDSQNTILVNISVARQKVDLRRIFHFEARPDAQTYYEFINRILNLRTLMPSAFRYDQKTAFHNFHFNHTVPKRTGEHAQIEKRLINPGVLAYQNEKSVASQLFGVTNQHSRNFEIKNVFDTFRYGTLQVENWL